MHSLFHIEYARAVQRDRARGRNVRAVSRALPPDAPPGRLRAAAAHVLGTFARRLAPEAARRAVG